jgi:hypothetical protein
LSGSGCDPVEIGVVVDDREGTGFRRRGDEEIARLAATLMLGCE